MTPQIVVMVTSSYPRFAGDSVGTFMEPIATSLAGRGHEVHVVAPWHPALRRPSVDRGVRFHFYRYAPHRSLNVFGYASAMRADVRLRGAALAVAPLALAAGWRMARRVASRTNATVMHGHWIVPGGITAALAAPRIPLVVSVHGSDVFVAERLAPARAAARHAFRRAGHVTACSPDLRRRAIALGADPSRSSVVPYGVDAARFRPNPHVRARVRQQLGVSDDTMLVAAAGRLVHKKGFEYLIDAVARTGVTLALAGRGGLDAELKSRAAAHGLGPRVRFLGDRSQDDVAELFAAADVIVTPSVRDDAGNVDGLPNVVMEALASGTPLITTAAGGIAEVVTDGRTALLVPERDPGAIARAVDALHDRGRREEIGAAARQLVEREYSWGRTAQQFEEAYRGALAFAASGR